MDILLCSRYSRLGLSYDMRELYVKSGIDLHKISRRSALSPTSLAGGSIRPRHHQIVPLKPSAFNFSKEPQAVAR